MINRSNVEIEGSQDIWQGYAQMILRLDIVNYEDAEHMMVQTNHAHLYYAFPAIKVDTLSKNVGLKALLFVRSADLMVSANFGIR
jgi:hypothetical protein